MVDHPVVGAHYCVTAPFRSRHTTQWINRPAPVLGQDNHAILKTVLGYSDERIEKLQRQDVIGTQPTGLG